MNIKKRYILMYVKSNAFILILVTSIVFFSLFLTIIFSGEKITIEYLMLIIAFTSIIFIPGIIIFLYSLIYIERFNKIIKLQEKLYNTTFNNKNEITLQKNLNYLSDEWFIQAGSLALHYKYIKSINFKTIHRINANSTYYIIFKTQNNQKYKVTIAKTTHYNQIRKWWNNLKENDNKKM